MAIWWVHNNYNDYNESLEGDIFISIDRVKENSLKYNDSFESELMRVLIHGTLHLLGYEDSDLSEKKIMTNKENYYLKLFEKFKLCNDWYFSNINSTYFSPCFILNFF